MKCQFLFIVFVAGYSSLFSYLAVPCFFFAIWNLQDGKTRGSQGWACNCWDLVLVLCQGQRTSFSAKEKEATIGRAGGGAMRHGGGGTNAAGCPCAVQSAYWESRKGKEAALWSLLSSYPTWVPWYATVWFHCKIPPQFLLSPLETNRIEYYWEVKETLHIHVGFLF